MSKLVIFTVAFFFYSFFSLPTFAHEGEQHREPNEPVVMIESLESAQASKNQIWTFALIALAGFAAGSFVTFILLTTTLHPKK